LKRDLFFKKTQNRKYTNEEISLISEILSGDETRTEDVLGDLVKRLNALPCNQSRPPRTVLGVRIFIKKYIDIH